MDALASESLVQIGSMIIDNEKFEGVEWDGISVSATIENENVDMSGFAFKQNGDAQPGTPKGYEIMERLLELQKQTQVPGQKPWKAILIQIKRSDMKVNVQFEYENANRWKVTPANIDEMKRELKPQ